MKEAREVASTGKVLIADFGSVFATHTLPHLDDTLLDLFLLDGQSALYRLAVAKVSNREQPEQWLWIAHDLGHISQEMIETMHCFDLSCEQAHLQNFSRQVRDKEIEHVERVISQMRDCINQLEAFILQDHVQARDRIEGLRIKEARVEHANMDLLTRVHALMEALSVEGNSKQPRHPDADAGS